MINRVLGVIAVLILAGCSTTAPLLETDSPAAGWTEQSDSEGASLIRHMPAVQREFRAAWVATVDNIDWPSKPGLSSAEQQNEMRDLLDRARMLNLNAIVFQIRPTADAFYESEKEPWSYYLTGENGKSPDPFYDPLTFAIDEAHRRGIELHAWVNPYRAYHPTAPDTLSDNHISQKYPDSVHQYGEQLWMDPGSPDATEHSLEVIMDIVDRYDIDGIHMDDYFYPYAVNDSAGARVEFPDSTFYSVYGTGLSRGDWRRRNVDNLILRIHSGIKERKPWVLFGISPFGIWRPGYPSMVKGFDAYDNLFADAKKWLNEGWVDYFTPQLYWAIESSGQPYVELLKWWIGQNTHNVHMWPGNFTSRIILTGASHWEPQEIVDQVKRTRETAGASGNVHFSMRALMPADSKLSDDLAREVYSEKAVVPASTWLPGNVPAKPTGGIRTLGSQTYVSMSPEGETEVRNWIIRIRSGEEWKTEIVPGWNHAFSLKKYGNAEVVVVQAVTRLGNVSDPAIYQFVIQ